MNEMQKKRLIGFSLVLVASFFNGIIPAVTQKGFQTGMSVETILCARFAIGVTCLWIFILLRKENVRVGWKNALYLLLLGGALFLATTCMNESYKYLPGAVAALLVFLYVVIVVLIEIIMGREKAEKMRIMCMALALLGLAAVVWSPVGGLEFRLIGILFSFGAALFYALQSVGLGAKRLEEIGAMVATGYMLLVPATANILRCAVSGQAMLPWEPVQWVCVILLGAGAAFIAPVCYCRAVKTIGASDTSIINTSEPVFAYFAGIIVMSDSISLSSTIGGLLIVSSIILLNLSKKRKEKEEISP